MSDSRHVVCPHCGTTNRIPTARLHDAPNCGHCHGVLFTGQVLELTASSFRKHVQDNGIPLVVDFWAPWCGPCQMMAPQYAEAVRELEPSARLAKLNTDSAPELAGEFGIRGIPTLMVFKGGRELARHSGAMGRPDIIRWVRAALG